jgi:putative zinc finger protein
MDSHLDAERLAAFVDGSLSRAERAACEAHAADCPRCLQLLAAMARTDEAVPKPPRFWSRIPVAVRWGVPFAAAAIALALWVNLQPQRSQSPPAAAVAAPERSPAPPQAAESRPAPAGPDALRDAPDMKTASSVRDEVRERRRSAPASQATAKAAESAPVDALTKAEVPRAQPVASAPPPPVAAPSAGAAAPAATNESAARLRADSMDRMMTSRTAVVVEVTSPDPSSRWRAMGAAVQRSTDGGKTWTTHAISPRLELLAGSSPSRTVAWLVGRAGSVLLCVEAGDCRQLPFPEAADLTAVRAQSELQAEVATADGRAFATSDGGKTWTRK